MDVIPQLYYIMQYGQTLKLNDKVVPTSFSEALFESTIPTEIQNKLMECKPCILEAKIHVLTTFKRKNMV